MQKMSVFKKANNSPPMTTFQRREHTERLLSFLALGLLIAAWFIGYFRADGNVDTNLTQVMPDANSFVREGSIWKGIHIDSNGQENVIGYIGVGDAPGYGGPLKMMVAIDTQGKVIGAMVINNSETPSFFNHVVESGYLNQFLNKSYSDPFKIGNDIDGVTGATFTSGAIAAVIRNESRQIAGSELGLAVPKESEPIHFGAPEITIILLYVVAFIAHRPNFPAKKWFRWGTLLASMVILGFWLNRSLTIANITSLLSGYWPDWRTNLYWFFLIGGILFVITVDGKNPYCSWFCPFGAVQECLHAVGQGNSTPPREWAGRLKWMQRGLAFLAIFFGLALRQSGATSFEVFGTMFGLLGNNLQWALLIIVLLASLFTYRPWCNYICPIEPVVELITHMRRWTKGLWKQLIKTQNSRR
jgi:hypothetical protein